MKNLIFINGTMGVGKTTVCQQLKLLLPKAVFLDGDWCWDADPFVVNEETKELVQGNIAYLLNSFLACSQYENIIFCWVMDFESIYKSIIDRLQLQNCEIYRFTLTCSKEKLTEQINADILQGKRKEAAMERSLERLNRFEAMPTVKICTDGLDAKMTAEKLTKLIK